MLLELPTDIHVVEMKIEALVEPNLVVGESGTPAREHHAVEQFHFLERRPEPILIAAELAIRGSPRVSGTVLADAVGISVEGHPVADAFSLTLDQLTDLSYHNPAKFRIDLSSFTDAQRQAMGANRAALAVYGGKASFPDPTLLGRLQSVRVPVLVVWGESDRVADPEYGRAFAAAIPGGRFQLLSGTGHMPMLETPDQLLAAIRTFTDTYR